MSEEIQTLLRRIVDDAREKAGPWGALIGVAGAQGSGKTFQCRRFVQESPLPVASFSMDDVYYSLENRKYLASTGHPLFLTRGPPGTHDISLAIGTMVRLVAGAPGTPIPCFDKRIDDQVDFELWPRFPDRADAVLVDGWCLGALPPDDSPPLNAIEWTDSDGLWRAAQREMLATTYAEFFSRFHAIVYLKPPSWEVVKRWRAEQEVENLGRPLTPEDQARLDRFMQHYERITRSMMAGGHCAGWMVELDEERNPTRVEARP